jgi:hypothetical protein
MSAPPEPQENPLKTIHLSVVTTAALLFAGMNAYSADAGKDDGNRGAPVHRDFDTVDVQHRGYLTSDDVKNDAWVRKNFAKCNVKHDGRLSREEYANCHE